MRLGNKLEVIYKGNIKAGEICAKNTFFVVHLRVKEIVLDFLSITQILEKLNVSFDKHPNY